MLKLWVQIQNWHVAKVWKLFLEIRGCVTPDPLPDPSTVVVLRNLDAWGWIVVFGFCLREIDLWILGSPKLG